MILRTYRPCDCEELADLFYHTVHTVHKNIVTHASITTKPFFEKRGYRVIREQQVERQGIFLTNFVMKYP